MSVDPELPPADVSTLRAGVRPSRRLWTAAVVAAGGAAGTLARAGVGDAMGHPPRAWPWSTLVINATGSGLLGVLLVILARRFPEHRYARALFGTGLLGGYTTFSTLSVDAVQLARFERPGAAALFVVAGAASMLGACLLGVVATGRMVPARPLPDGGGSG